MYSNYWLSPSPLIKPPAKAGEETILKDMRLDIVPIDQREAFAYVAAFHRHHKKPVGSIFQIGLSNGEAIIGVAIVGRPTARMSDNGWCAEVTRLCTDGTPNACSKLYAACWQAARSIGYKRLITYILNNEPGTSLRAAGWNRVGERGGGSWSREGRPRVDTHPLQRKILFEKTIV